MSESPPAKRARYLGPLFQLVFPPAPSGAIAASRSAAIWDDEYRAIIKIQDVEEDDVNETFFPESTEEPEIGDITIGDNVKTKLGDADLKEEYLRNAVYTDLHERHDVEFPDSSSHWLLENIARLVVGTDLRYNEQSLANVLNEFYRTLPTGDAAEEDVMPERLLRGLLVTTTSLPDMTVVREQNLYFGEFKNKNNSSENAAKQCAVYLFALLYFYRVCLCRPIKAVFGFFVCGCGCFKPALKYDVGLIRLSVPEELGQSMKCEVFERAYDTTNLAGLQLLVRFLTSGKLREEDASLPQLINNSDRIPALLTLPEDLWTSPLLVKNGTTSMVFQGTGHDITPLLRRLDGLNRPDKDALLNYMKGNPYPTQRFYLKIRLTDTMLRSNPTYPVAKLWDDHQNLFRELYCVRPVGNPKLGVFLMFDWGTVLRQTRQIFPELKVEQFLAAFYSLWHETMKLTEVVFHGDALLHNFVYDAASQRLTLIDLDEGVHEANVPKRAVEKSDTMPNSCLRYPNYLRSWRNRVIYTQLQLGTSFLLIIELFEEDLDEERKAWLDELKQWATQANRYLGTRDKWKPELASSEELPDSVTNFIATVKRFIDQKQPETVSPQPILKLSGALTEAATM